MAPSLSFLLLALRGLDVSPAPTNLPEDIRVHPFDRHQRRRGHRGGVRQRMWRCGHKPPLLQWFYLTSDHCRPKSQSSAPMPEFITSTGKQVPWCSPRPGFNRRFNIILCAAYVPPKRECCQSCMSHNRLYSRSITTHTRRSGFYSGRFWSL